MNRKAQFYNENSSDKTKRYLKISFWVVFIVGVILLAVWGTYSFIVNGWHYQTLDNGRHTGTITAIETSGIWFKTTTVYFKSDAQSSQEDRYCLINETLIPQLQSLAENKSKVTIKYIDYLFKGVRYCNMEEGGIIVGVDKND